MYAPWYIIVWRFPWWLLFQFSRWLGAFAVFMCFGPKPVKRWLRDTR